MNENDTITNDEWIKEYIELDITEIMEELKARFDIETEYLGDGILAINEFSGYINSEDRYEDIEFLGENIVEKLRILYDYDFDYDILRHGYELTIHIF